MSLKIYLCLMLLSISISTVFCNLIQASVLFRHGDRAPGKYIKSIPNDENRQNSFFPVGLGGLTNTGKLRAYSLGKFLRQRYDELLGPVYLINDVESISSDSPRARLTLQLVLAGLYPPNELQQWEPRINWQPTLVDFKSMPDDKIFVPQLCKEYQDEYHAVANDPQMKKRTEDLGPFRTELTSLMGRPELVSVLDMNHLYHTFAAEEAMNLTVPSWAVHMYPNGKLRDGALLQYHHYGYNNELKRLSGGVLLNKLLKDMEAMANKHKHSRKLHLYSGHELNVVMLLQALGLFDDRVPEYTSAVIVELHEINRTQYIKVFYHSGIPAKVQVQKIPGCSELCSIKEFTTLLKDVIATENDLKCKRLPSL